MNTKKLLYNGALAIFAVSTLLFFFHDSSPAEKFGIKELPRVSSNLQNESAKTENSKSDKSTSASHKIQQKNVSPSESPSLISRVKSAPAAINSAVKFKLKNFKPDSKIDVPIIGDLKVEILDERTICVVGAYDDFLKERFAKECHSFLKGIDSPAANLAQWSKNVFYNVLGAEIILKYRPSIADAFSRGADFQIDGAKVESFSYWLNPMGQASFPNSLTGEDKLTRNAFVRHYAFLKFATPFEDGKTYTLKNPLGQNIDFSYSQKNSVSEAIKINQIGYSPDATRKYAYVGAWLGGLGSMDFSRLLGKDFYLVNSKGEKVFSSKIKARQPDSSYETGVPFTGENVFELDFSTFKTEGTFRIHIPTVGNSETFKISNEAVGEAFYTHAKGLFHKRCGIAKEKPYTNWTVGECHMHTYQSDFPPNNLHYKVSKNNKDCGFFTEDGKQINVSHFTLISERARDEKLDIHGGWHDAADYDRRPYHYDVVNDLLSAYLFRPDNFSDGQLNIPESSNGIADILDEAEWGMRIWLSAQQKSGAVGGWIEAVSHPIDYNPSTDTQRYYLSAATRESTMQYAAHASMLALAFKNAGQASLSKKYSDSAILAYEWASDPKNRFSKEYNYPFYKTEKGKKVKHYQKIIYRESTEIPIEFVFKAAFNLSLLTGEKKYETACENLELSQKFAETSWRVNPFFFSEFLKYGVDKKNLQKTYSNFKDRMIRYADERLGWQENNYPYRAVWYPANHNYVTHMSWGKSHPLVGAKFFVNAYELTREKKYRDAAHLCNDYHNGANPNGQTMTAGLGKNYPIRFLDLCSYSDGIEEYVLGITPYRNTFGIARDSTRMAHSLVYPPRPDRDFKPEPVILFPKYMTGENPSPEEFEKELKRMWPIWRRFANVEAYSVAASEYTVSETIAPAMAITGWLLERGYKASDEIKDKKPSKLKDLKGYYPLP